MGLWSGFALAIALGRTGLGGMPLLAQGTGHPGIVYRFLSALVILAAVVLARGPAYLCGGVGRDGFSPSGIRVTRIKVTVFAIAGLFAGLTAMLMVARNASGHPILVHGLLLPSIAAVVGHRDHGRIRPGPYPCRGSHRHGVARRHDRGRLDSG